MGLLIFLLFAIFAILFVVAIKEVNKEDNFDKFYGYGDSTVTIGSNSDELEKKVDCL